MGNKKKGLADTGEGEFILNESGTSVSTDKVEGDEPVDVSAAPEAQKNEIKKDTPDTD